MFHQEAAFTHHQMTAFFRHKDGFAILFFLPLDVLTDTQGAAFIHQRLTENIPSAIFTSLNRADDFACFNRNRGFGRIPGNCQG